MNIKPNQYYKTRYGKKVRVYATEGSDCAEFEMSAVHGAIQTEDEFWYAAIWDDKGYYQGNSTTTNPNDIVSEWIEDKWLQPVILGPKHGFNYTIDKNIPNDTVFFLPYIKTSNVIINSDNQIKPRKGFQALKMLNDAVKSGIITETQATELLTVESISVICSCGGKIDSHKPECPENQEAMNEIQPFYILDESPQRYLGMPIQKKCECGSDSLGSPKHSEYCPKYEKNGT